MKIIVKSIAVSALFFLVLSCTENDEPQQKTVAKDLNASLEDDVHPKRKVSKAE